MTVRTVKKGTDSEVLTVGLGDGSFFMLRIVYLPEGFDPGRLEPGSELSDTELVSVAAAARAYAAEQAGRRLIARSEQCIAGLRNKLRLRGHAADAVDASISRLVDAGLLDDRRYASAWIRSRRSRRSRAELSEGRDAFVAGLLRRGVSSAAVRGALDEEYTVQDEALTLTRWAEARAIDLGAAGAAAREAMRRSGFSPKAQRLAAEFARERHP